MTVNDGQTVYRATKDSLFPIGYTKDSSHGSRSSRPASSVTLARCPGASVQSALPNGRWYYYGLFFRSGLKWHRYMVTSTLLPRNRLHAEYLWNSLPPYYQYLDDQMRGGTGDGDLRKFLNLIGFDLDLTREYVESLLDLYHTDFCPVPLLRRLGGQLRSALRVRSRRHSIPGFDLQDRLPLPVPRDRSRPGGDGRLGDEVHV